MKLYTDRFEAVLPDSLRRRYRVPRGTSIAPPSPAPPPKIPPNPEWEALIKWSEEHQPPQAERSKKPFPRWPLGLIMVSIVAVFIALALGSRKDPPAITPEPQWTREPRVWNDEPAQAEATPISIPEPTPDAYDPWKHWKPVPRAEPVPMRPDAVAHMPDGNTQAITVMGAVNRQEELPLKNNSIGDTYYVAGIPFVWTQLDNGTGAWIDPIIK